MKKQDIIRQFGKAKYQAALESAKTNNFHSVDDLLVVNGEIVITEDFERDLVNLSGRNKR